MTAIKNTTIISVYDLISSAILANTTLSAKFDTHRIYQLEPKHKSTNFYGYPYFWISVPQATSSKLVFDNSVVPHEFSVTVLLRMDWEARDKAIDYANAFLAAIADYESTFAKSGYYETMVDLIDVNPNQIIDSKQLVETEFKVSFKGQVRRG